MNWKLSILVLIALVYAAVGCSLLAMDARDYVPVGPTEAVPGMAADVPDESMPITEAKRNAEIVVDSTRRWVEFRTEDIEKRERLVGLLEGFTSSGLDIVAGEVGRISGPFAPLAALLGGYFVKRRGDRNPEEARTEKEAARAEGRKEAEEFGRKFAEAVAESVRKSS